MTAQNYRQRFYAAYESLQTGRAICHRIHYGRLLGGLRCRLGLLLDEHLRALRNR